MPTHTNHTQTHTFYFVTFSCYKWLPLLEKVSIHTYFKSWTDQLIKKGAHICGFVIMPNHFHLLVFVEETCQDFNHVIGEGKRFMAYEIVKRLKKQNDNGVLTVLEKGVQQKEALKGKKHQVFRLSFDAKIVEGNNQIYTVLDYIHHNPVSKKWSLVKDFIDYPYSSARFYELNDEESPFVNLKHFRDFAG